MSQKSVAPPEEIASISLELSLGLPNQTPSFRVAKSTPVPGFTTMTLLVFGEDFGKEEAAEVERGEGDFDKEEEEEEDF